MAKVVMKIRAKPTCCLWLLLGATGPATVSAQEFSDYGNRWYDVEVSVFTNEVPRDPSAEVAVSHTLTAAYLPRLRELQTRSSVFAIDFPEDLILAAALVPTLFAPESTIQSVLQSAPEPPAIMMGPVYSPAVRSSFKIADFDRDPYIDLGTRAAQFTSLNRTLDGASDHRLLWHKVWRQPMQGRSQTPAVFVSGGEMRAAHMELEGSLRLSDNAGSVMLDINLWLNGFRADAVGTTEEWKIPALPFPLPPSVPVAEPELTPWTLAEVWQLAQTRELGGNELYYLDHPAFGVLIQIRPYMLPPRLVAEDQEDF